METISRSQEDETQNASRILRSIGAVLAGFVVVVVLSLGTDVVLHVTRVFPAWGQPMADGLFALATIYRILYGIVGSYITARLAPDRPMQHAMAGGVVALVISIIGAALTWNKGPAFGPHWYPLALVATALPCAWAGGKLRIAQLRAHAES